VTTTREEAGKFAAELGRAGQAPCNETGPPLAEPCLRERVLTQLDRARGDVQRAIALEELNALLARHPEIARILDLLEQVQR
jgi:hypothetical protein